MYFPTVNCHTNRSWNSSWFGNRLQARGARNHAAIPGKDRDFSLLQSTQIGFAADPASYSLGTKASFHRSKADKARH
jgi:hypothetical protein